MTNIARALAAVLVMVASSATARAEPLSPTHGRSIDLGALKGVAYYTVEKGGYRVVVTLAEAEGKPVRLGYEVRDGKKVRVARVKGGKREVV